MGDLTTATGMSRTALDYRLRQLEHVGLVRRWLGEGRLLVQLRPADMRDGRPLAADGRRT